MKKKVRPRPNNRPKQSYLAKILCFWRLQGWSRWSSGEERPNRNVRMLDFIDQHRQPAATLISCLPAINIISYIQAVCARAPPRLQFLSEMILGWMLIVVVVPKYVQSHVRCALTDRLNGTSSSLSLGWLRDGGPPLQWFQSENERGWGKI